MYRPIGTRILNTDVLDIPGNSQARRRWSTLKTYRNGDLNYEGEIDADDFALIDFNLQAQGSPFPVAGNAESISDVGTVLESASSGLETFIAVLSRRRHGRNFGCGP